MVLEKQRDIAILTAMGATAKTIQRVFMLQGLIIGLIGTVIGNILGIGISWILDTYKLIRLEAEIYSIPYVPFHVRGLGCRVDFGDGLADQLSGDHLPRSKCGQTGSGRGPAL